MHQQTYDTQTLLQDSLLPSVIVYENLDTHYQQYHKHLQHQILDYQSNREEPSNLQGDDLNQRS